MHHIEPLIKAVLFISCVLPVGQGMGQVKFTDVTTQAGIKHEFIVYEGMFGGGACVFDLNNDGFEDLYITGGTADDVLYLNQGDGTFVNIFERSGMTTTRHYVTQGVAGADVNRDGWIDLFITAITSRDSVKKIPRSENIFFLNNGDSTFTDATRAYGISDRMSFSTGACFGDFNADGFPDLYVGNYFQGYEGKLSVINDATIVNASQTSKGYLLKNVEGRYFKDVYNGYGLNHKGFGFGAVFTDFDNDNDQDLFVNHDFGYKATPNIFLINDFPRRSFHDETKALGMDLKINAMGTAVGDYNNDGLFDYYVTNIRFNRFMVNQGEKKPFVERAKDLGMGMVSISWGANFADFDHDTDLDLFVANGDLNPNDVPMADYYFENESGRFSDVAYKAGLNDYGIGRGSVVFDIENDGDLDLLVVNQKPVLSYPVSSITRLYRNDSPEKNWLKIKLQGRAAERNGIGSRVTVVAEGVRMIREIDGGSSHLSQNSTIAHFGLGSATVVDSIIVTWLGGQRQILTKQPVNTMLTILQSESEERSYVWIIVVAVFAGILAALLRKRFRKHNLPEAIRPG